MRLAIETISLTSGLAAQEWIWERRSVESTLSSLGWRKRESVGHRDTYSNVNHSNLSVYHDGDHPKLVELTAEAFADVESLDDLQYEDKVDDFYEGFVIGTKQISDVLGKPVFSNRAAAMGFPDDQDAVWLSQWNTRSARIMLQQKHEDRELPFRICIVVAPLDPSK